MRHGHLSRRNRQHELLDLCGRNLRFCRLDIVLKLRGGHVRAGLRHGHLLQLPCRHLRGDIGDKRVQQLRIRHVPVERRTISVCELFHWPVFTWFGGLVRELHCGNIPTKCRPGSLRELFSRKLLCFDWSLGNHGMSCWQLLWRDGTFSRVRCVCRGLLFGGLRLGLFGLCRGDVHRKHGARFLFELPIGNLSCLNWPE